MLIKDFSALSCPVPASSPSVRTAGGGRMDRALIAVPGQSLAVSGSRRAAAALLPSFTIRRGRELCRDESGSSVRRSGNSSVYPSTSLRSAASRFSVAIISWRRSARARRASSRRIPNSLYQVWLPGPVAAGRCENWRHLTRSASRSSGLAGPVPQDPDRIKPVQRPLPPPLPPP